MAQGQSYEMPVLQYHETPNSGIVVTIMEKLAEGTVHASTLIERGSSVRPGIRPFPAAA
jgi:hypothetical protein